MKIIYLISTETLQYPSKIDKGSEHYIKGCILKIGESYNPNIRLNTLDNTFAPEKPILLKTWNDSKLTDKQIHNELEKRGFLKYRTNREFFEFDSVEQAIRIINDILYGSKNLYTFELRDEQTKIVNGVCNLFNKNKYNIALINAKMRSGKCFICYNIIKNLNFKRILILTYKPNGVYESWKNDIDHIYFNNFEFKYAKNLNDIKFDENTNKIQIIFASFQDAIGEMQDNHGNKKSKDKWLNLYNQHIDLIIKDELHYGNNTEKSNNFLSKLKYNYELHLSGTPLKAILSGFYEMEQIFTWTYYQEQLKRKTEKENGWITEIYRGLPEFQIFICKYKNEIIEKFKEYYKDEEKPTNYKLFSNENLIDDFLTWIKFDSNINKLITNHMFWYLPGIDHCEKVEKKLKSHPHFKHYNIINASGNNQNNLENAKNIINNSIKTITLSCGRWNTGTTIEKWNSVWMLDDGYSAENWFQTTFRCGSPYITKNDDGNNLFHKEKVHIVDFNSDRTLKCFIEYSTILSKYEIYESFEYSKIMLDCMPIYSVDGSSINQINSDILIEYFNNYIIDSFGASYLINNNNLDDEIKNILKNINGNIKYETKYNTNQESKGRGKNNKKTKIKEDNKEEIENIEDYIIKAKLVTKRIKNFLYVVDKISNINDIFNYKEEFELHTEINVNNFKILLDKKFINEEKINESIYLFNINNDYLYN